MDRKDCFVGARVRYAAEQAEFHGQEGVITEVGSSIRIEFDNVIQTAWRNNRVWDCTPQELELIEVVPEIKFTFDDFIRGGAGDDI